VAIGKPILEKSSQGQKRSTTQILTLSDPKIRGQEPKTLSKRAHNPLLELSITHIFSGALPLVNLGQFCDLANPHQDSFGNGADDLTQYCLGPSSGFGG